MFTICKTYWLRGWSLNDKIKYLSIIIVMSLFSGLQLIIDNIIVNIIIYVIQSAIFSCAIVYGYSIYKKIKSGDYKK